MASSLHDRTLTCICGWHDELCSQTMISGSPCSDFHDRIMSVLNMGLSEDHGHPII